MKTGAKPPKPPADALTLNMGAAALFFDRIKKLPSDARARLSAEALGSESWQQANAAVTNTLDTQIPRERLAEVRQGIEVARSVFDRELPNQVAELATAVVRGILVRHLPNLAHALRTLYQPFQDVIPFADIQPRGKGYSDPRAIDAKYQSFPSFEEWARDTRVDVERWNLYASRLPARDAIDRAALERARRVVTRAAAVDTGAIEGLYDVDSGFTMTVAFEAAVMDAALNEKGQRVRGLIESQLAAYQTVLDFATQERPIVEAWIRNLHAEICGDQDTYLALTEFGPQEQALPKGAYKSHPNHVITADGTPFAYAPVDLVPAEMHRLVEELESDAFTTAHPVQQAAYAHYAFIIIHPFADGNGRVARALASVFTYRALSVPVLVYADRKGEYLAALREADVGNRQAFVDQIFDRTVDAILLAVTSLASARAPQLEEASAELARLYRTRGGYTHAEVDIAGYAIFDAFREELDRLTAGAASAGGFSVSWAQHSEAHQVPGDTHRLPAIKGSRHWQMTLDSPDPARGVITVPIVLEVPVNAAREDDIRVRSLFDGAVVSVRMADAHPVLATGGRVLLRIFAQQVLASAIAALAHKANARLRQIGY